MMAVLSAFLAKYWMQAVWTVLVTAFTAAYRKIRKEQQMTAAKNEAIEAGILGILHDRLQQLCTKHLENKYITVDDLENLEKLYKPYRGLGGNGTIEKLYKRCQNLPIVEN